MVLPKIITKIATGLVLPNWPNRYWFTILQDQLIKKRYVISPSEDQLIFPNTAQKMKFFSQDFFSKCNQIRSFLRIWSHLLKKFLMETAFFKQWNHQLTSVYLGASKYWHVWYLKKPGETQPFTRHCNLKMTSWSVGKSN